MNVLFVCTENVARSPLAALLFQELVGAGTGHEARSAGTASHAVRRLTTRDLAWADVVAVMEPRHLEVIRTHWPEHTRKTVILDVPDEYCPDELELRTLLTPKLLRLIDRLNTHACRTR